MYPPKRLEVDVHVNVRRPINQACNHEHRIGTRSRQHPLATATGHVFSFPFRGNERGGGEISDAGAAGLGPRENAARESQDRFQPVGVGYRTHVVVGGSTVGASSLSLLTRDAVFPFLFANKLSLQRGQTKEGRFKSSRFTAATRGCCVSEGGDRPDGSFVFLQAG